MRLEESALREKYAFSITHSGAIDEGGRTLLSSNSSEADSDFNVPPELVKRVLRSSFETTEGNLRRKVEESVKLGFDGFVRVGSCACTVAITDRHHVVASAGGCMLLVL